MLWAAGVAGTHAVGGVDRKRTSKKVVRASRRVSADYEKPIRSHDTRNLSRAVYVGGGGDGYRAATHRIFTKHQGATRLLVRGL